MITNSYKLKLLLLPALSILTSFSYSTPDIPSGHVVLQLGAYASNQGKKQHINIDGLIGDEFTIRQHTDTSGVVGLGYYFNTENKESTNVTYGLNAFYLARTYVQGHVVQENLFRNLSYKYHASHTPIYVMAKSLFTTQDPRYDLSLDVGIGPNFMKLDGFKEKSLDGMTIPDDIFSKNTFTTPSATLGLGVKFNQILPQNSLECGYRFFYLGKGHLKKQSPLVLNSLKTGTSYANAIMCSVSV